MNVYAANDLRIQPNQFFHWDYTNPDNGKTWTAPKDACGCWFWYDEDALLNSGRSTKDRDIYRYAEALLDAAESIAQSQGVTAEAAAIWHKSSSCKHGRQDGSRNYCRSSEIR